MRFLIACAFALFAASAAAAPATVEYFPAPARPDGSASPFSSAVRVGDTFYLSGSIGVAPDGKLPAGIEAQSRQTMDNIGGVLKRAGLGWNDVYHCTAMLSDMANWPAFNTIYVTYFPGGKMPARSAFGANGLALGALLELECQAYAGKK
jgi:2-iminobutanoate/2-iminopropanoate deaminase